MLKCVSPNLIDRMKAKEKSITQKGKILNIRKALILLKKVLTSCARWYKLDNCKGSESPARSPLKQNEVWTRIAS